MNALFGTSFSLENSHIAPNNISSLLYFKTKICVTLSLRIDLALKTVTVHLYFGRHAPFFKTKTCIQTVQSSIKLIFITYLVWNDKAKLVFCWRSSKHPLSISPESHHFSPQKSSFQPRKIIIFTPESHHLQAMNAVGILRISLGICEGRARWRFSRTIPYSPCGYQLWRAYGGHDHARTHFWTTCPIGAAPKSLPEGAAHGMLNEMCAKMPKHNWQ